MDGIAFAKACSAQPYRWIGCSGPTSAAVEEKNCRYLCRNVNPRIDSFAVSSLFLSLSLSLSFSLSLSLSLCPPSAPSLCLSLPPSDFQSLFFCTRSAHGHYLITRRNCGGGEMLDKVDRGGDGDVASVGDPQAFRLSPRSASPAVIDCGRCRSSPGKRLLRPPPS